MAGSISVGGKIIATHTGPKGAGTVDLDVNSFKIGGKVLATHNSETDEVTLSDANTSNMSFDANHAGIKTALNASGDAPIYACRAWIKFRMYNNDNTTYGSANIDTWTDHGTADFEVTFENPMPTADYVFAGGARYGSGINDVCVLMTTGDVAFQSTTSLRCHIMTSINTGTTFSTSYDPETVWLMIIG